MTENRRWEPLGPDVESILAEERDPLLALSEGRIPAIICRQAYSPAHCQGLIDRFIDRGLMRDPNDPEAAAGITVRGSTSGRAWPTRGPTRRPFWSTRPVRMPCTGSCLKGYGDPVKLLYGVLDTLAGEKRVMTAREPDGRQYGPAIFRIHYGGHTYKPHIDHVTLREKRFDYDVTRFGHQFAGVLCFQNALHEGRSTQAILHRCMWTSEVQESIAADTFPDYARRNDVSNYTVDLEQGDLYFFNTRLIHEVPAVEGDAPRIVLATFIGYSPDDSEVYVWS